MKLTLLFILVCLGQLFASQSYSQNTRLSINMRNATVEDVLSTIEENSEFYFLYNKKIIDVGRKVNINADNKKIMEILDLVFDNTSVNYTIVDRQIVLSDNKLMQQQKKISGTVSDMRGQPLPGVTIFVKGSTNGTITDADGKYSLANIPENGVVVFSFVGMRPQEINVEGQTVINVSMAEETIGIEEVVAIGFGTQKKVNLTGAVDQVGSDVFENRPLPNVTRGLEGVIPNLNISMGDGKPIRTSSYNIRGTTSIGSGGSALILIDGVPGNPDFLNPSDIESVSVLKDAASAAIYGARGSFGVVLITTKKPKTDKIQISYSGSFSLQDRTIKPDLVTDGYDWAKMFDDAYYSWNDYKTHPSKVNSVFPFSQDYLEELKKRHDDPSLPKVETSSSNGNYIYYGSTDWLKELYADVMPSTDHSLSVSGKKDNMTFYISGQYMGQGGIFRYNPDKYRMYNFRAKGSMDVFKWLTIENDFSFFKRTYFYPILNHSTDTPVFRRVSDEAFPIAMLKNPDGTLTQNASIVFGSFISGYNYQDYATMQFSNTSRFKASLSDKLKVYGDFTFQYKPHTVTSLYTPVPYSVAPGTYAERGDNRMKYWDQKTNYSDINIYADYEQTFGKHYFKGLIGYNYEHYNYKNLYIMRYNVINPELPDFSLVDGENFSITGGGNEWKFLSGFYRFNYNYDEKYLFEINGRYDGSSKFSQNQHFGFFPSFSTAWRISEEPFWGSIKNTVSNFKIRASYGSLGNGNIDPYTFLETMSVKRSGVIINGTLPNYSSNPAVVSDELTWEKVTSVNIGTDIGLFDNRLNTTFDYYTRYTTDMITASVTLPAVFGASEPEGNYADLKTNGWELTIQWADKIRGRKPINYDLKFILSDYTAHITKYSNPSKLISDYYVGSRVGDIWGFVTEGFFTGQDDINSHANQSYVRVSAANTPMPGDIKFKDLDDSKVIDLGSSTVDDPGDRKIIGNSTPRFRFGFTSNFEWNNFFFSAFLQGVAKRDYWPGTDNSLFWGPYNRPYSFQPKDVIDDIWSEENPDTYFPRLRGYTALNSRAELTLEQTRYLQNAAYVRLKNLTFGYSLPASLIKDLNLTAVKVYFSGQNLWVYSPMFKHCRNLDPEVLDGADPETNSGTGNGMRYPMLKTFTLGVNVTF